MATRAERTLRDRFLVAGLLVALALVAYVWLPGPSGTPAAAGSELPAALAPESSPDLSGPQARDGTRLSDDISRSIVGDRDIAVRTLDSSMQPIARASVFVSTELGVEELGVTDSEGVLVAQAPVGPGWFGASKIGYATAFSRIATGAEVSDSEVVLTLDAECTILGVVRAPDGVAPRFPVTVHAWPESVRPTAAWLRSQSDGAPLRATVDADGQFELRGLSRGKRYCVTAAAEGCVADSIECRDAPGAGIELKLKWVYALEVRAVDSSGQHVRTSGALHEYEGTTWRGIRGTQNSGRLTTSDPRTHLIMLDPSVREGDSSNRILLIYLRGSDTAVGPFAMTWRVPGYVPKDVEVLVPRLVSVTPRVELVHLEPHASCWGAASIRVSLGDDPKDTSVLALGELRLSGVGTKETYSVSIDRAGTRTLDGIPCGTYQANLLVRSSAVVGTTDGSPVTIRSDTAASLDFDLSNLGAISISVVHSTGDAYEGAVEGYLVQNERARIAVQFRGAPYVVNGLPPGSYGLSVTSPASLAGNAVAAPVSVSAGGTANLQVIWPD